MTGELVDLAKKVEVCLKKRNIVDVTAEVKLGIDISGSMKGLYGNGTVQKVVTRIMAVACKFDDNYTLDMFTFTEGSDECESATPANFDGYVDKYILNPSVRITRWGGTSYMPIMSRMAKHYVGLNEKLEAKRKGFFARLKDAIFGVDEDDVSAATSKKFPGYMIIITDGENDDHNATLKLIEQMQGSNIFWQFVGIGRPSFEFLKQMDARYKNVGFTEIKDLSAVSDEDLYENLITEKFAAWLKR